MELGAKLKQARLEAGLSQRQLCGDVITRNMLSQIENGAARPSMDTLRYLASRLGKTLGYFLEEEETVSSKEQRLMGQLEILEKAEKAITEGRNLYAAELLEQLEFQTEDYCREALSRKRLLILAKAAPQRRREICDLLPDIDEELLLRARVSLDRGNAIRAGALLDGAENQTGADWNFLRGEVYLTREQFEEAARCYREAETAYPEKTASRLERCYRELGDFKMAYEYACKQR